MLVFETEEFTERLRKVRHRMASASLEALIVSDPCNIYYLTGFVVWAFYTPQALLIFQDEDPLLVIRKMDVAGARLTSWLSDDQIIGYDESLVQTQDGHPFSVVAQTIIDHRHDKSYIGIESESYYLSVRSYQELSKALPNAQLIDSQFLVNWVRFQKSPAEVKVMKKAGALLSQNMMQTANALHSGVTEREVVSVAYASNILGTDDYGGAYSSSPAFVLSGERIGMPHLPWTDGKIATNTQVNLELMGNRKRYQCTMGRTVYVGQPPAKLLELEKIVCDAIETVLNVVKPGVACETVARTLYRALAAHGIEKDSRCGYSVGITYPPTGGELTASFRLGDETELVPGATMHFLPAIWSGGASIIISEPFVVTETGYDLLCDVPRALFVRD